MGDTTWEYTLSICVNSHPSAIGFLISDKPTQSNIASTRIPETGRRAIRGKDHGCSSKEFITKSYLMDDRWGGGFHAAALCDVGESVLRVISKETDARLFGAGRPHAAYSPPRSYGCSKGKLISLQVPRGGRH